MKAPLEINPRKSRFKRVLVSLGALLSVVVVLVIVYIVSPDFQSWVSWRVEVASAFLNAVTNPTGELPTPIVATSNSGLSASADLTPTPTPRPATSTPTPTPTNQPTPTPLPAIVTLPPPKWEKEDQNNCGPTTLAEYLRFYGWEGNQTTVSQIIKPLREDKNVNVEEITYYVSNHAGWLKSIFRVGGNLQLMKSLLANGLPVMVERAYEIDKPYWPDDDQWSGHYLLITGYDDGQMMYITQDTWKGENTLVSYTDMDASWKAFNRVYILVYRPEQEGLIQSLLGENWDADKNRQDALDIAQQETDVDPKDAFAWFNLGSNLVYFERYDEANVAYDKAREIGLPQRMFRYQFGPFIADFHSRRTDDLLSLTDYALKKSNGRSEEAHVWRAWAFYQKGDLASANGQFLAALEDHPDFQDALYGLNFIGNNP